MRVVEKKLDDLVPYSKNAKRHDETQIANVAESIKQFGFVQPIVVDKNGVIVIGHCRALAAKRLGMDKVPCVMVDELTEEQVKALRIVDNKTNESPWDMEMLAEELPELHLEGFTFDWGLEDKVDDSAKEDNYDFELPAEPRSQLGDIYQLGRHRLMCGDSTSVEDCKKLVGGEKVDMLLTDPPYNVDYQGTAGKLKNDHMEDSKFREFLSAAFRNATEVMKPGAAFYIWHADSEGYNFRGAARDTGLLTRQCLIWVKSSLVLGRQDFQWKHEPCLYGELPLDFTDGELQADSDETECQPCLYGWLNGKHYFFKNRKQTTVLYFDKPIKSAEHPTMKPVKLFDYLMQCSSKPGERVLDLFGGSGTTIIAAEQNGRLGYVMEYDPKFADVIIDRWETLTGEKAVKLN